MRPLLFISILFILFSCKKDDLELIVQGLVFDPNLNMPVSGAQVVLQGQEVSGGTFNNNFNTLASTTTNSSGRFELVFPRKNISTYRFVVAESDHFDKTVEVSGDQIRTDEVFNIEIEVLPMAYYTLRLNNSVPTDEFDRISYRNTNADLSCQCCNNQTITLTGEQVDTTFTCAHQGESWLKYWYEIEDNGNSQAFGDSVFLTAFDTTYNQIEY